MTILMKRTPFLLSNEERIVLAKLCHDSDNIPKHREAGSIIKKDGQEYQIMHNGLLMVAGCYYGKWVAEMIKELKGHHEPQEEKVFFEVLARLDNPTMMVELGSYWAYYTLWFLEKFQNAKGICVEPDVNHLAVGKKNAEINQLSGRVEFMNAVAGNGFGEKTCFSNEAGVVQLPLVAADSICAAYQIETIDILHMDVQGAEYNALKASEEAVKSGKIRFLFVSTHHYCFSGDPLVHQKCKEWIVSHGGHVIAEHGILESYNGDGLIVASFDKRDKDFLVAVSRNVQHRQYRAYEEDICTLLRHV